MRSRIELFALVLCACGGTIDEDARDAAMRDATVRDATQDSATNDAATVADSSMQDAGFDAGRDAAMDSSMPMDASVTGEPAPLVGITSAHNVVRANASPTPSPALAPLTWSNTLATAAQSWANNCMYAHTPNNPYGQNIWVLSVGTGATGQGVTDSWASEVADYDYANNSCSDVCGHYTQIVWRSSTQLGCGVATCNVNRPFGGSGPWQFVVCNYNPPGNFVGQKPY